MQLDYLGWGLVNEVEGGGISVFFLVCNCFQLKWLGFRERRTPPARPKELAAWVQPSPWTRVKEVPPCPTSSAPSRGLSVSPGSLQQCPLQRAAEGLE